MYGLSEAWFRFDRMRIARLCEMASNPDTELRTLVWEAQKMGLELHVRMEEEPRRLRPPPGAVEIARYGRKRG